MKTFEPISMTIGRMWAEVMLDMAQRGGGYRSLRLRFRSGMSTAPGFLAALF